MALQNDPAGYSRSEGCRALGVSRSGLYAELLKPQRPRQLQDRQLSKELSALFAQSRGTYGSRRLQQMLVRQAIFCGRNRILRLMSQLRLQVVQKRRFRPITTQSRHAEPIAPNRLKQLIWSRKRRQP
jgi:putative transposase